MKKSFYIILIVLVLALISVLSFKVLSKRQKDEGKKETTTIKMTTIKKEEENLLDGITLSYQSSIRMEKSNMVIYFDPYKIEGTSNDANYIFITHSHYDHYSEADIKKVMNDNTKFIVTSDLENKIKSLGAKEENITVVYPNKDYNVNKLVFSTIPAYNVNTSYHKKSNNWVGYNVTIDDVKYYIVGDSDVTDEIKNVTCDAIFVPVGGTYTMTDKEAAEVVNKIKPKYAVPYHYGEIGSRTNAENFVKLLDEDIKSEILK